MQQNARLLCLIADKCPILEVRQRERNCLLGFQDYSSGCLLAYDTNLYVASSPQNGIYS